MRKRRIAALCTAVLMLFTQAPYGCGRGQQAQEVSEAQGMDTELHQPEETENDTETEQDTQTGESIAEEGAPPAPSVNGALRVEGTMLVDRNGEPVQLRGISTHGIAWFPDYINEECFAQLHGEWKVSVVRLAMYTAESGGYCNGGDKEYLKGLIRQGVGYAAEHDMYVIIDWHILSDSNPNMHLDEAKEFFAEMSEEYKDADNVLYEICNEPNGGTSWQDIRSYAGEIIEVIRSNDADGVILVPVCGSGGGRSRDRI